MEVLDTVRDLVNPGENGPFTYHCQDCDRTFEVDAPPSRVICSDCGNKDVERRSD